MKLTTIATLTASLHVYARAQENQVPFRWEKAAPKSEARVRRIPTIRPTVRQMRSRFRAGRLVSSVRGGRLSQSVA